MNRNNLISVVAVLWIGMIVVLLVVDAISQPVSAMPALPAVSAQSVESQVEAGAPEVFRDAPQQGSAMLAPVPDSANPEAKAIPAMMNKVVAPYAKYVVTQGLHGFSYGQNAVDLSSGKDTPILSPINGSVTQLYTDYLGNPTLVIENDHYQVTLMHGNYTVQQGDALTIGQTVGTESNNGNTVDWWGRSCRGRACGYHTHLNIFDKLTGKNINPLDLISPSQ